MDASTSSGRLARLRDLGARQWQQENQTVNLIASDNAYPLAWTAGAPYPGHIIQEGLAGQRPFAGAHLHDEIEGLAAETACEIFGAEHANLQPHSCSQANQAVYHALLDPGDRVCALDYRAGGHLTHGLRINFSGRMYRFSYYGLGADGRIDYEAARELVLATRPKLLICGSSAYPRLFDADALRSMADEAGAYLMFDLSHEAGLIAGGAVPNPVAKADVATMSLDKTLRGPFGAMVLCRAALAERIDRAVHPGTQSSFSIRRLVDSAHALLLTQRRSFREYAQRVLANSRALAASLAAASVPLASDGTDKHYLVADVAKAFGLSGLAAEERLEQIGLLVNRQSLPWDSSRRIRDAGGIRLGSAWATSRGYGTGEFEELADIIVRALSGSSEDVAPLHLQVRALVESERPLDVWRSELPVTEEG